MDDNRLRQELVARGLDANLARSRLRVTVETPQGSFAIDLPENPEEVRIDRMVAGPAGDRCPLCQGSGVASSEGLRDTFNDFFRRR